jgi:LysR family transcriptional regulator, regulator for bpeEF and oprC
MDQLVCMRVFARVVETGSFSRAAENLKIAPPTATTAVAQLEQRLGVRLLHRTTRRLNLTDEGRAFYEGCVRLLDELAEMEESLSTRRVTARGRLRTSMPNAFIPRELFAALPGFLARHPQLTLELALTDQTLNLVGQGIDCAVRAMEIPDDSTLIVRHISPVYRLTCASPAYLATHGVPRHIADLERHNCIGFISPSTGRIAEWTFEKREERRTCAPRGNLAVSSLESAVAAAAAGLGVVQAAHVLAMPLLRSGMLQPVLAEWAAPGPPLAVVYPSNRYLTAKVRAFTDFIFDLFPKEYAKAKGEQGWWSEVAAMAEAKPRAARRLPQVKRKRGP